MNFSARLRFQPRATLAALLLVLALTVPTVVLTVTASAAPTSDTAKKKKCKKGYKKVKGKCKKKKKKKKADAPVVVSVNLESATLKGKVVKAVGSVEMSQPFNGKLAVSIEAKTAGGVKTGPAATQINGSKTIKFHGQTQVIGDAPVEVTAIVDGKRSNTITVTG